MTRMTLMNLDILLELPKHATNSQRAAIRLMIQTAPHWARSRQDPRLFMGYTRIMETIAALSGFYYDPCSPPLHPRFTSCGTDWRSTDIEVTP